MKSLFEISSDERQRILEMHETATKKNYMFEQKPLQASTTPNASSDIKSNYKIKGAREHTSESFNKLKELSDKKFGSGKYDIISPTWGYISLSDDVLDEYSNELSGAHGGTRIENEEELFIDKDENQVKYVEYSPDGTRREKVVSGPVPLYQIMKKHLVDGVGTTAANRIFNKQQIINDFYKDPKNENNFISFCNIIKPNSVFKLEKFPGLEQKCSGDFDWSAFLEKIGPDKYIMVES